MDIHCPHCKCNLDISDTEIARHLAAKGGRAKSPKKVKSFSNNFARRWANHKKKEVGTRVLRVLK